MTEDMDTLRDKLNETSGLAKLLFEQQFIRRGGRKPADPEWSDLDESERDEWWDRALDAGPLIERERSSRQAWADEALRLEYEMEELAAAFHERARLRAEADGRGDSPQCDGDCGNGDCHTTSAVAAWQMAAAAVQRRLTESSRPQGTVHPDSEVSDV